MFKPKIFETLKDYTRQQFGKDVLAGLIVGIVALPLAIAFAIASGVSPEKGLYTAVIAGLIVSVLGGSRVQIGGPTWCEWINTCYINGSCHAHYYGICPPWFCN